jgi:hypothetical protein
MSNVCSYDLAGSWGQRGSAEVVAGPWGETGGGDGATVIAFPRPRRRARPRPAVVLMALLAVALLVLLALPISAIGGQTVRGATGGGPAAHATASTGAGGSSARP